MKWIVVFWLGWLAGTVVVGLICYDMGSAKTEERIIQLDDKGGFTINMEGYEWSCPVGGQSTRCKAKKVDK